MPEGTPSHALQLREVEKQYGGLRPLRIRRLQAFPGACLMLVGFDRPAAEALVNLIIGATLPEKGEVVSLGRPTRDIVDGGEWLSFVERFGIVSDRIVLLEAMTVAQNLAITFDIELDPIPAHILQRVETLGADVGIDAHMLNSRVAETNSLVRARLYLARALALDPEILLLDHPTAMLTEEERKPYALLVKKAWERRGVTTIGLTMDETFARATGGRLLSWQPATGELREGSRFRWSMARRSR
jgi:ABC-type transporter Mla maintaining outer membrane lipid asymmetry ATPase subunit MlaF